MDLKLIVAMDVDGCIGRGDSLPWRLKADMARFKRLTEGDGFNAVIMGRKTRDSLPDAYRPLPERVNIVMSRDMAWSHPEADVALYPGRAIEVAYAEGCESCWVIGGAQIYAMFADRVNEMHITTVHTDGSGDVKFPEWNRAEWKESVVETIPADDDNDHETTYAIWTRN